MFTNALVFPFICTATDLPQDDILPPSIEGARLDYTAEMSPLGPALAGASVPNYSEASGASTSPLVFTSLGTPTTVTESDRRFWRFPGGAAANVSSNTNLAVQTRFMRVRVRETLTENKVLLGNSIAGGQLISANADRFYIHGGTQLNGPAIPPSTGWHTVISTFNGANSVIDVDGTAVTGPAGTATANGFRLAASGAAVYAQIDVSRVGMIPAALTTAERSVLREALNA